MSHKWLSYVPVTLAVLVAVGLAFLSPQSPQFLALSSDSLAQLDQLNHEYGMTVIDLSGTPESPLMTQLYQADALLPAEQADENALGLIASMGQGLALLLQPTAPLSPQSLETAVQDYSAHVPEFVHVETDQLVDLQSPVYDWELGTALPEAPVALSSEDSTDSTSIKVAVIDSGVDESHEIFSSISVDAGWNTFSDDDTMYDDVGHGTHIAGIIASYAPDAEIVPYKIVNSKGGKLSNVLEAYSKALDDHVDIINSSFGVSSPSYALEALISRAYSQGVIVVAAAGNNGADTGFYPAHYSKTIAVASVDSGSHQLPSSNYGTWVDVAAYGYHVRSSLPHNEYGYKSGTSQATAFVSAAVARLLQDDPGLSFKEVLSSLEDSQRRVKEGTLAGTPIVQ